MRRNSVADRGDYGGYVAYPKMSPSEVGEIVRAVIACVHGEGYLLPAPQPVVGGCIDPTARERSHG